MRENETDRESEHLRHEFLSAWAHRIQYIAEHELDTQTNLTDLKFGIREFLQSPTIGRQKTSRFRLLPTSPTRCSILWIFLKLIFHEQWQCWRAEARHWVREC